MQIDFQSNPGECPTISFLGVICHAPIGRIEKRFPDSDSATSKTPYSVENSNFYFLTKIVKNSKAISLASFLGFSKKYHWSDPNFGYWGFRTRPMQCLSQNTQKLFSSPSNAKKPLGAPILGYFEGLNLKTICRNEFHVLKNPHNQKRTTKIAL